MVHWLGTNYLIAELNVRPNRQYVIKRLSCHGLVEILAGILSVHQPVLVTLLVYVSICACMWCSSKYFLLAQEE